MTMTVFLTEEPGSGGGLSLVDNIWEGPSGT